MKTTIEMKDLRSFRKAYNAKFSGMERNAASAVGIFKASIDREVLMRTPDVYHTILKTGGITDQKQSGRCWMYASLNMLRVDMMRRWKLADFQFSHGYLYFYDKIERSNAYLERVIELSDRSLDDRLMHDVVFYAMEDGGWWTTFVRLVEKYGLVPDYAYEDAENVRKTNTLVNLLGRRLKKAASEIIKARKAGKKKRELTLIKDAAMEDIYRICVISLGLPPEKFDLILRDKDDKLIERRAITPLEFYRQFLKTDLNDYVELADFPVPGKKHNTLYRRPYVQLPVEIPHLDYLSVSNDRLKEIVKKMLLAGIPVWFGADVGRQSFIDKEGNGTLAAGLVHIDGLMRNDSELTKAQQLLTGESGPTHAMVFVGFDENADGLRFKVENSWGSGFGKKGYLVMDEVWFERYVYEIVAKKNFLKPDEKKALAEDPIELLPWQI